MPVFRVEKIKNYTTMSNHHLRDMNLSLKAKGLLSQMLSLPENWDYTLKGLSVINKEKVDAIRSAVKELEQAGYIVRDRIRDEKGQWGKMEYLIREVPLDVQSEEKPEDSPEDSDLPETRDTADEIPVSAADAPDTQADIQAVAVSAPVSDPENIPTESSEFTGKPGAFLYDPMWESPMSDFPVLVNPTQINTEVQSTDLQNKETYSESIPQKEPCSEPVQSSAPERNRDDAIEKKDDHLAIWQTIKANISYDALVQNPEICQEDLNDLVDVMLENLCTNRKTIRVAKNDRPASLVKDRLFSLHTEHIRYVLDCLCQNTTQVRNIRQYLLTCLYNAASGIESRRRFQSRYESGQRERVPMGASGNLGEAEMEAIRRVLSQPLAPYIPLEEAM